MRSTRLALFVLVVAATASLLAVASAPSGSTPDLLLAADVGPAISVGILTVYPIAAAPSPALPPLEPIADAMAAGRAVVEEMPAGWNQFRLFASNQGDGGVFAQGGGFYGGGGQDRGGGGGGFFGAHDSGELVVACVEKGRTEGPDARFVASSYRLAHPALRGMLLAGDQHAIWNEVARERQVLGAEALDTTSYRAVEQAVGVREARRRTELLSPEWPRAATGIAVAAGDRVLGVEVYGSGDLLRRHLPLLLASYAVADAEIGRWVPCQLGAGDIEAFLAHASDAEARERLSLGAEDATDLRMGSYRGEAVRLDGSLIHFGLYDTRPLS